MQSFFFLTLAVLAVAGEEVSLRATLQSELLESHRVCEKIKNSKWWESRKTTRQQEVLTNDEENMDLYCAAYNNNPTACKNVTSHNGKPIRCEVVGAKSSLCKGNLCNYLNDGTCNFANTHGECLWFNKDWVRDFNKFWTPETGKERVKDEIEATQGCFRNPCSMSGYEKPERQGRTCRGLSVPGLYRCAWCSLPGEGMGCQMVEARGATNAIEGPPAACAWATSSNSTQIYARGSWNKLGNWIWKEGGKCQCDASFTLCKSRLGEIGVQGSEAYKKWPSSSLEEDS